MIKKLISSIRQWLTDRRYRKLALKRGEITPRKPVIREKLMRSLKLTSLPKFFGDKKEGL
jgi:hypothetical protein